jgi:hypothetical protein
MQSAKVALAALLISAVPVCAQDVPPPATEKSSKFGIGIVVGAGPVIMDDEFVLVPMPGGTVLFPFASKGIILEPEIGLFRAHNSSSSGGFTHTLDGSALRVGLGALFVGGARGNLRPYIGPRAGLIRSSTKHTDSGGGAPGTPETTTRNSIYVAFVAGAQYFFSPHFSLGGEAQLQHVNLGNEKVTPSSGAPDTNELSFQSTAAMAILRFFY